MEGMNLHTCPEHHIFPKVLCVYVGSTYGSIHRRPFRDVTIALWFAIVVPLVETIGSNAIRLV